jgi:hypothetical protein
VEAGSTRTLIWTLFGGSFDGNIRLDVIKKLARRQTTRLDPTVFRGSRLGGRKYRVVDCGTAVVNEQKEGENAEGETRSHSVRFTHLMFDPRRARMACV